MDGKPAAAMAYGIDVLAQQKWGAKPDVVLSGSNEGNNVGVLIPHSGTVGATVNALAMGVPAIALSGGEVVSDPASAAVIAQLTVRLLDELLVAALGRDRPPDVPEVEALERALTAGALVTTTGSSTRSSSRGSTGHATGRRSWLGSAPSPS